jgi:perosamine synthetase
MKVHLSRPDITQAEIDAVVDVLKGPTLALGPKLAEFEQAFCDYTGRKHAVGVNSGTSGLHLIMQGLDIKPGDEVITSPFTFVATVNSIMMVGARPVFADIDPETLNIDPDLIEEKITPNTKAIEPVAVFGNPWGIDRVCEIAEKHSLDVIEDSAEALGSELKGKKAGTFGKASIFAFYPNKQITTGEGGMILTDDEELAQMCFSLRNQGRGRGAGWLAHDRMGYNFRICDINCALGIVQLARIDEFKAKRKQIAGWYQQYFAGEDRIMVPQEPANTDMCWFVFVVRIKEPKLAAKRNDIISKLIENGIQASNYFPPVHLQPYMVEQFGYKEGDFPVTEKVSKSTIALPFHVKLTESDVKLVCETLKKILDQG